MHVSDDWMLMIYEKHGTTHVRHDATRKETPRLVQEKMQDSAFGIAIKHSRILFFALTEVAKMSTGLQANLLSHSTIYPPFIINFRVFGLTRRSRLLPTPRSSRRTVPKSPKFCRRQEYGHRVAILAPSPPNTNMP